ncbi:RagB/SusD family nutrient uptake outer membrane protein [Zobellia amurskyensis]|uniref:RagB/SusD family nutrient uptake outer membrane protein n=1 Tax=Zobellia amurskyensis TaxID=248905 RepID=A0A7X2ZXJ0_9FLAO|nr:RagB/SusD family nutrient uptake outer membrane protein [Zobellia amurskyensis]MUH38227.1 RagB/SusD family nutrient uptake outer membrane protein [Zobellia amurskyensis]
MKIKYIACLIGLVLLGSCDDFLEEEPLSELSSDQFFSEPDHAFSAVNSLYRTGAPSMTDGGVYSGTPLMLGAYMSGFFTNEYAGQELHVSNTQQLTLNGENIGGYLQDRWRELYLGISRANNAIRYIPETPELNDAQRNQLLAEAKFFRAFAYYYLVRWFGPVPLTTEPYESIEDLYLERSSIADVYGLIESDLTEALAQGNLPKLSMVDNGKRVTSGAVASLLAEVYLTMSGNPLNADRYSEAASLAQKIINGEYGSYALTQHDEAGGSVDFENSAYNKIRKGDASAIEHIYVKEYDPEIGTAVYPRYSYPVALASEVLYDITNGAYQPSSQFLDFYNPDEDLRAQERQYFHSTYLPTGQTFATAPFVWHDDTAIFETANSGKDFAMYSYADVLLIAAEAVAMSSGVNADAVDYLAQVRSRAYWMQDSATISAELSGLGTDAFVEEVWKERHRELVFEFKNWFDIVRTGQFPVADAPGTISFVNAVGHTTEQGKQIEQKHLLLPLPGPELQRNPALGTENNGY